jgi:hypothetical protein
MNRTPSLWFMSIHQHVYRGDLAIAKSRRLHGNNNLGKPRPVHSNIDIPSQPSQQRIHRLDLRKNRKPANDLIRYFGLLKPKASRTVTS